jgi:single-stranded-DNA-specific exonuclease
MFNPPSKYWKIKDQGNPEYVEKLSRELNVSPIISNLLIQRGIFTSQEALAFFKPTYKQLHDPFLMKDMEKAVLRIEKAINKNERILVYGDYDVDGTTSVAMMYLFLRKYHENLDFYVPNRYNEGYGF